MLEAAVLAAALAFIWWRAEKVALPLLKEKLERDSKDTNGPKPEPLPSDLRLSAYSYKDEWAREQAEKTCHELYNQYGNWDDVRNALANNEGA